MKKYFLTIMVSLVIAYSFEAQSAVTEVQACNLKENKTMEDILALSDELNQIQDGDTYIEKRFGQLIMIPTIEQTEKSEFDFYFLNYWGSYQIYGNDMSEWSDQGKGDAFMQKMGTVVDCRTLNIFNTIVTREYPGD